MNEFEDILKSMEMGLNTADTVKQKDEITTRVCTTCKQEKPLTEFRKQRAASLGRMSKCKRCHSLLSESLYLKKKADRIAQIRKWQSMNTERVKGYIEDFHKKKKENNV